MKKIILLIFVCLISNPIFAKNYMFLLGGGGEGTSRSSNFDKPISALASYLEDGNNVSKDLFGFLSKEKIHATTSKTWITQAIFNGSNSKVTKTVKSKIDPNFSSFTKENFDLFLIELEDKITNDFYDPEDQLVIIINSHGSKRLEDEKTHKVSVAGTKVTDLVNISSADSVSLDPLERITELVSQKGLKMAIIDQSCFGGNIHKLANPNTCTYSSSNENTFNWFNDTTLKNLKTGKTLEQVFLDSMTNTPITMGHISTEIGEKIKEEITTHISKYIVFDSNYGTLYSDNIANKLRLNQSAFFEDEINSFNTLRDNIIHASTLMGKQYSKLLSKLEQAEKFRSDIRRRLDEINAVDPSILAGQKLTVTTNEGINLQDVFDIKMFMNMDKETVRFYEDKYINAKTDEEKSMYVYGYYFFPIIYETKLTLTKDYPVLKQVFSSKKVWSMSKAESLAKEYNKFYKDYYNYLLQTNTYVKNTCENIIF